MGINKTTKKGRVKVPVVMQLEALECGAACITMILAYFGKWIPLEQVRTDCGVSRDGSNAQNMVKAARSYGLRANGYKTEPDVLREDGDFPCIIHWNFNHFVVLCGFKNNKVYINDPARGNCVITMDEFDKSFTGICLTMEPDEDFVPSGKPKSVLKLALKRMRGARTAMVFVGVTSLIASIMGMINPAFSRIFMDRLLTGHDPEWFLPFMAVLAVFGLIQTAAAWIRAIYSLRINGKLAVVGSTSFMWKVLRLPMEFFSQRMAGDIQQRQQSNGNIASVLASTFAPLVLEFGMLIFYLVVMVRYSPFLSLIGIASVVIDITVSNIISAKRENLTRVQMRDAGKLAGSTVAGIEMIDTIKASGAENGYFEKWAGYQASVNTQQVNCEKLERRLGVIPELLTELSSAFVLIIGVLLTINGEFTVGMIMAFQGFLTSFTQPALSFISAEQRAQELRAETERVEDVMNYPDDALMSPLTSDAAADTEYTKLSGNIEIKNVTFGYSRLADPLIKDLDLSITKGKRTALVGASGCGKSTLSKLISGLYSPWSGEILFDGKKISEIDRAVFTGSLAVVDQDIILFEDTISNNIKMWDNSIEDFEVIMAARDASLHDDIMQRDGGYNYRITEGGKDFSGGQRQRMEIARVLAQDPTIIILDEATSALDAKTEFEVIRAINERGITCIVVAHRLSTIRDCDEIIVLDGGAIVERGTHDELYARGGYYASLVAND